MKTTLSKIVIYSHDGRVREIDFGGRDFSIITGASKTGKSAIIHIIDYCFGSGECYVPQGIIRAKVSWYAIILRSDEGYLCIARRNPDKGKASSTDVYVRFSQEAEIPDFDDLTQNSDVGALKTLLARFIGLQENKFVPPEGYQRPPLQATFSHSRIFCFQDQSLIDNKNQLFFNQQDGFVAQAIRDTLPFFVGAVSQSELLDQFELAQLRRDLKLLRKKIEMTSTWEEISLARANDLLAEARQVGLLHTDARPGSARQSFDLLAAALQAAPSEDHQEYEERELDELLLERDAIRSEYFDINQRIEEASSLDSTRTAYQDELGEQKARLRAVTLLRSSGAELSCPLCSSSVSPTAGLIGALTAELEDVGDRIISLHENSPRLQSYIKELKERRDAALQRLKGNQSQINAVLAQNEALKAERDDRIRRSRIQGRISSFLESKSADDQDELEMQASLLSYRIYELEENLGGDYYEERLRNAESNIADYMTVYARHLELEHSEGRTRLDFRRLTVIADTKHGPIRLENMGSGDNWVGCHVITHLALHRWFREKESPVPSFIILDQPSKAHYPPNDDRLDGIDDDDREAVIRLFKFLCDRASEDDFQVIVVDHADEPADWFQEAIVERWRGGDKLVPEIWPDAA